MSKNKNKTEEIYEIEEDGKFPFCDGCKYNIKDNLLCTRPEGSECERE